MKLLKLLKEKWFTLLISVNHAKYSLFRIHIEAMTVRLELQFYRLLLTLLRYGQCYQKNLMPTSSNSYTC